MSIIPTVARAESCDPPVPEGSRVLRVEPRRTDCWLSVRMGTPPRKVLLSKCKVYEGDHISKSENLFLVEPQLQRASTTSRRAPCMSREQPIGCAVEALVARHRSSLRVGEQYRQASYIIAEYEYAITE